MIGAIAGDIIGSVYEHFDIKTKEFPLFQADSRFTDDTVLTVATAKAILEGTSFADSFKEIGRRFPNAGYGSSFYKWLFSDNIGPYNSFGNGSAMRVSPVGFAFDDVQTVLSQAKKNAEVTHNHPEGIKGAQATALSIFLARKGSPKNQIKEQITERFDYRLDRKLEEIRGNYTFDVSCQGSVPEAIAAFLQSNSFVDAVRKAISLGGDSDTIGCIAGGIAQAYYQNIPADIIAELQSRLPQSLLKIVNGFNDKYIA